MLRRTVSAEESKPVVAVCLLLTIITAITPLPRCTDGTMILALVSTWTTRRQLQQLLAIHTSLPPTAVLPLRGTHIMMMTATIIIKIALIAVATMAAMMRVLRAAAAAAHTRRRQPLQRSDSARQAYSVALAAGTATTMTATMAVIMMMLRQRLQACSSMARLHCRRRHCSMTRF